MLAPNIPPKNPHSWSPCRWYLTWIKKTKNRQWARNIHKNIQNTKFHHVSPRLIARYKFYIYISSYFSKICHEFGGIQNWKEMVKSKPWAVAGIVQNSVHLSGFSSFLEAPKEFWSDLWSQEPRLKDGRWCHTCLGAVRGLKPNLYLNKCQTHCKNFMGFWEWLHVTWMYQKKHHQTFFQEFETSNNMYSQVCIVIGSCGKSMVLRSERKHLRLWHTQRRWNLKSQMDRRIRLGRPGELANYTNYTLAN